MRLSRITILTGFLLLLSIYLYRIGPSIADPDIWHQMALVREWVATGAFPYQDKFAYTETLKTVYHHEWGAGAILFFLTRILGDHGIIALRYFLAIVLFSLVLVSARIRKINYWLLLSLMPVWVLMIDHGFSTVRGQMYSFVFFLLYLIFLEVNKKDGRWWMVAWLILHVLWVNIHGGFVLGIVATLLSYLEQLVCQHKNNKRLLLVVLGMVLLIFVNPYGYKFFAYIFHAVLMNRPIITEWVPLYKSDVLHHQLFFLVSFAFFVVVLMKRGSRNFEGFSTILFLAVATVRSWRMIDFYATAWIYFVPVVLKDGAIENWFETRTKSFQRGLIALCVVSSIFFSMQAMRLEPWKVKILNSVDVRFGRHVVYPVGAVNYLRAHSVTGNLLVPFDWGAYVTWELFPNVKVSLDSRYEAAYPDYVVEEQVKLYDGGEGWEQLLPKYEKGFILTHRRLPLTQLLERSEGYKVLYSDGDWLILGARESQLPVVHLDGYGVEGDLRW